MFSNDFFRQEVHFWNAARRAAEKNRVLCLFYGMFFSSGIQKNLIMKERVGRYPQRNLILSYNEGRG